MDSEVTSCTRMLPLRQHNIRVLVFRHQLPRDHNAENANAPSRERTRAKRCHVGRLPALGWLTILADNPARSIVKVLQRHGGEILGHNHAKHDSDKTADRTRRQFLHKVVLSKGR